MEKLVVLHTSAGNICTKTALLGGKDNLATFTIDQILLDLKSYNIPVKNQVCSRT